MGVIPVRPPHIMPAEAQQERLQSELGVLQGEARRIAGATEIANRFILDGGDVDARQIPRAEQPRELDRIASIRLHLVAGFFSE